ncbi:MAG: hypothetical protein ABR880_13050 [Candidatus Sulfotelmatobacter sp.]|jgi:hypothetical protein
MESLTRLVTDSLARHGFDRPIDPRRLQWSRWFRCDSPHSLLVVPSKPGIFAIAEEILDFGSPHVGTAAPGGPAEQGSAPASSASTFAVRTEREGHDFSRAVTPVKNTPALAAEVPPSKRMLAVLQFSEDDDMAFTLDRMFTRINPMRARLSSGRCFLRFVVVEDQDQRRNICTALNQWMLSSAEKASGIPAGFSSSLELNAAEESLGTPRVGRTLLSANADAVSTPATESPRGANVSSLPHLDSGGNQNLHCPHPLPSGF